MGYENRPNTDPGLRQAIADLGSDAFSSGTELSFQRAYIEAWHRLYINPAGELASEVIKLGGSKNPASHRRLSRQIDFFLKKTLPEWPDTGWYRSEEEKNTDMPLVMDIARRHSLETASSTLGGIALIEDAETQGRGICIAYLNSLMTDDLFWTMREDMLRGLFNDIGDPETRAEIRQAAPDILRSFAEYELLNMLAFAVEQEPVTYPYDVAMTRQE